MTRVNQKKETVSSRIKSVGEKKIRIQILFVPWRQHDFKQTILLKRI